MKDLQGQMLSDAYGRILEKLSRQDGLIGTIFLKAKTDIEDPSKLRRLVTLTARNRWGLASIARVRFTRARLNATQRK
jgi:type I restriction enzyme M protein